MLVSLHYLLLGQQFDYTVYSKLMTSIVFKCHNIKSFILTLPLPSEQNTCWKVGLPRSRPLKCDGINDCCNIIYEVNKAVPVADPRFSVGRGINLSNGLFLLKNSYWSNFFPFHVGFWKKNPSYGSATVFLVKPHVCKRHYVRLYFFMLHFTTI